MAKICQICGLPEDLCVCSEIDKEQQKIKVQLEVRRWGKVITLIEGIKGKRKELNRIAKELKSMCACGGTSKDDKIILQGDQRSRVKDFLVRLGYIEKNIEVT